MTENKDAYMAMLDKSDEELRQGKVVIKTMKELEAMAAEWAKTFFAEDKITVKACGGHYED